MYMVGWKRGIIVSKKNESILLNDVSIQGDIVEKEKIVIDGKVVGDITANEVVTHKNSNITGNIKGTEITIGGKVKGNLQSDKIKLNNNADVEGVLNQKILSVEEGAVLKIKTETHK